MTILEAAKATRQHLLDHWDVANAWALSARAGGQPCLEMFVHQCFGCGCGQATAQDSMFSYPEHPAAQALHVQFTREYGHNGMLERLIAVTGATVTSIFAPNGINLKDGRPVILDDLNRMIARLEEHEVPSMEAGNGRPDSVDQDRGGDPVVESQLEYGNLINRNIEEAEEALSSVF